MKEMKFNKVSGVPWKQRRCQKLEEDVVHCGCYQVWLGALPLVEGGGAKHSPPGHGKTSLGTLGVMILRTSGSGSEDSGLQM